MFIILLLIIKIKIILYEQEFISKALHQVVNTHYILWGIDSILKVNSLVQESIILLPQYNFQRILDTGVMNKLEVNRIVDLFFHQCTKRIREQSVSQIAFFVVRQIALIISILLDYFLLSENHQNEKQLFHCFLIVGITYNSLQLLQAVYFYYTHAIKSQQLLSIATSLHHSILVEDLNTIHQNQREDKNSLETDHITNLKFSNLFYDFENLQKHNDVSKQHKQIREAVGVNAIRTALQKDLNCYKSFVNALNFGSVGIFIFGILVTFISPVNQIQHSLLQLFLVTIVLYRPKIYAILLMVVLAPFLLILLCFYVSFVKTEKKAKLPNSVQTSLKILSKCSQCSICFQDYSLEEQVIMLPCSEMHVFHSQCIKGWSKIKPNCPICRFQIS